MLYDYEIGQFVAETSDLLCFGEKLRDRILEEHRCIPAGTIVVYTMRHKRVLMFQTIEEIIVKDLKNTTLIGYEQGSFASFIEDTLSLSYVPTFRFRDIRFPTRDEIDIYLKRRTV